MIKREYNNRLQEDFYKGKVIIIIGARQVGKTTLVKEIVKELEENSTYLNGDESDIYSLFENPTSTRLKTLIGNKKVVIIDEAQQIPNIGKALKLMIDTYPEVQLIVTGSSAFDMGNRINEPLTGRKFEYQLFSLSFKELVNHFGLLEEQRMLEHRLVYGSYPDIVVNFGDEQRLLKNLVSSYLYRDILQLEGLKKPALLTKLLYAVAMQIGSEVSINEIAQLIGSNGHTVEKYIDLLEKSYIIFRLKAFSRNMRNELKKSQKIYFFDNGVRNAILGNFSATVNRTDVGALWENYIISERLKKREYGGFYGTFHFWRTTQQQEIDLIEDVDGQIYAFEFKWSKTSKKSKIPQSFINHYPDSICKVISPENYSDFLS